ncbi:hypothetical protein CBR_g29409 [Chara braunii]|uniref:RING-type domain-containing protein n=1 Tax=Chara braunii TaxID=69332 RepID=A0A388JWM9_CHABU|nr:hypothetical protein CBR_g29409 [Chara braunii]|eukprot:GBG62211.1 hypothetical protein CBR_g29409 [Chara braunii]
MDLPSSGTASDGSRNGVPQQGQFGVSFPSTSFIPGSLSAVLALSGLVPRWHSGGEAEGQASTSDRSASGNVGADRVSDGVPTEVSIRIIGMGEQDSARPSPISIGIPTFPDRGLLRSGGDGVVAATSSSTPLLPMRGGSSGTEGLQNSSGSAPTRPISPGERVDAAEDGGTGAVGRDGTSSARYDLQQAAKWIEQSLPFTILLLSVFIREHMQGFLVFLWLTAVLVKANDLIRRQTALKGDRRTLYLVAQMFCLSIHIGGVYWWYNSEELWKRLLLLRLKRIPGFWEAIWIILINDTLVRFGAMVVKCAFLATQKHSRGRSSRRQAQFLTWVEYTVLFYRSLLPAPVWYRFFLNETYGHLFSSLITGLYLTCKLTGIFDKLCTWLSASRAVFRREVQYGQYATQEEVRAAGDMCAICQEKMHSPISLRCHHVFCEDCVSEWFERERTCPLCRAVVKQAGLRSFGDGTTSLLAQIF